MRQVLMGLMAIVVLVILGFLAWFGFRFVQEEVLGDDEEVSEEDTALFEDELARCIALARAIKGFRRLTYRQYKAEFPHCSQFVTLRVWRSL